MKTFPGLRWSSLFALLSLLLSEPIYCQQPPATVSSTLQIISVERDGGLTSVYKADDFFEAPNWTRDGAGLVFDQAGKIMKVPVAGGAPVALPVGEDMRCNGSHGVSPDGKSIAISCSSTVLPGSRVYVVDIAGGTPRVVTVNPNSYFHSWSPDGRTILFTRPDHGSINIFAIPLTGGEETKLTMGTGTSDDPDYSADGKFIYFNSDRSGSMQIWRMHPDGSSVEQITSDDLVNWTPHPSPNGKLIVFLSYEAGVTGHPANKNVTLRLMSLRDRKVRVLTHLVGGAGTINVPSWSSDSRRLAFVSFQPKDPAR